MDDITEDIKILEEMITWDCLLSNKRQTEAIENLIKGYRELEDRYLKNRQKTIKLESKIKRYEKYLENKDKKFEEALEYEYQEREIDYIPKSKIIEKIEELKKKYELADDYWQYDYDVDMNTIEVLQELMEDK